MVEGKERQRIVFGKKSNRMFVVEEKGVSRRVGEHEKVVGGSKEGQVYWVR